MPWICLTVPPLLLVVMLVLGRIETGLGTAGRRSAGRSSGTVVRSRRRPSLPLRHHRVRPAELGRSMRRMRYVTLRPQSRPRRKSLREHVNGPRHS
jgi:hypothetical protein